MSENTSWPAWHVAFGDMWRHGLVEKFGTQWEADAYAAYRNENHEGTGGFYVIARSEAINGEWPSSPEKADTPPPRYPNPFSRFWRFLSQ